MKVEASKPSILGDAKWDELRGTDPIKHIRNFVDCVKSREKPTANSTVTRYGHIASHAAAIAWKLDRKLAFDPVKESFINDEEANRMCSYTRRAPWHA